MEEQISKLGIFIDRLEHRRDNETLQCTTNKVVLFLKDLFDAFSSFYNEYQTQVAQLTKTIKEMTPIPPQQQIENVKVANSLSQDDFVELKKFTQKQSYKVLYTGDVPTTKRFNEIVGGHTNVSLVVTTKENITFGCHSTKLKTPNSIRDNDFDVENDKGFFAFTLNNSRSVPPTKFTKKDVSYTVARFASNNETMLVEAEGFFKLATGEGTSMLAKDFAENYDDKTGCGSNLFVLKDGCDVFDAKRLDIIEWK
ncbi:hypothetical protein EIN_469610 [Entamoeba invadens IP1]|uniref:TLDc domain-containing protein n=1 Tax=Entamoeba invadens IP1 TaxID=370355 RepID=A0A0A1TUK3_ENTIV|nr:hypothetical protein EIN_469610 [Entamoeba invadens IP1]ELP83747.1 hypothetical protein EIN_469610 [Entamoeba invadens IP1]|eukprot:XP_004183093.1 hypothetical protein EIN_469610 [Entamoeba invadens IP1]